MPAAMACESSNVLEGCVTGMSRGLCVAAAIGLFPTVLHFDPNNRYQNITY